MTEQMQKLLAFIEAEIASKGIATSFDEMMKHMNLRSKSGVHRMLTSLVERGKIKRLSNRARAIVLSCEDIGPIEMSRGQLLLMDVRTVANELEAGTISAAYAARRLKWILDHA